MRRLLAPALVAGLIAAPILGFAENSPVVLAATGNEAKTDAVALGQQLAAASHVEIAREAKRKMRLAEKRAKTRVRQRAEKREAAQAAAVPPHLQAIAACESGGNPRAIGGGGMYRGKYQFSRQTWAAVGGSGDPATAPEAEQDKRAAMLYARSGPGQWPVCGR